MTHRSLLEHKMFLCYLACLIQLKLTAFSLIVNYQMCYVFTLQLGIVSHLQTEIPNILLEKS